MENRLYKSPFFHKQEDSTGTPPDNAADSPFPGDEAAEVSMPSPRKRRGGKKKVISVPIIEADGSRSKGEVYPPPDSWSWRKYGQKPIKGSPYPSMCFMRRGYYRCSSSKGCPARKQVERSSLDPTMLLITYCSEHNHQILAAVATKHHHTITTSPTTSTGTAGDNNPEFAATDATVPYKSSPEEPDVFAYKNDNGFSELAGEFGWFSDMGTSTLMESTSSLVGSTWNDTDVALMLPIRGEEDQSLFGDLGELPECSIVFRRYSVETPCCAGTG